MPNKTNQIYQIKVTLDYTQPPIWRRIQVPGNTTLLKLHDILQIVMGWRDYHLHMFTIDGSIYGDPADDEFGDHDTEDEARIKLSQIIYQKGQRFRYEYDFGDSWSHTLEVEKILPPQEGIHYPICLVGKRACPPEDVGGVGGYKNFLEAVHNPDHDEHDQYLTWIGGEFDLETFNLEEVNARLWSMGRGGSTEAINPWSLPGDEAGGTVFDLASTWLPTLPEDQQLVADMLPLRRDIVTLLTYVQDNKVIGTQSTGNFPLKAVSEICSRFVNPPQLEVSIGEHDYRVRSETNVWSLYFRHILAAVGGLVKGGPGRRWILTPLGERFLAAPSTLQVWLLLVTWWTKTNWAVASPYVFEHGYMPPGFSRLALIRLIDLPLGESVSFDRFAERMIKDSRMVWPIENQEAAWNILRSIIRHAVIEPLVDFGILQAEYMPHKTLGAEFHELSSFTVSPFGNYLLIGIHPAMTLNQP